MKTFTVRPFANLAAVMNVRVQVTTNNTTTSAHDVSQTPAYWHQVWTAS